MVRLIDDLLDMSRVSRCKVELRNERVLLAKVIQQAVEASRPLIEANGCEFTSAKQRRPARGEPPDNYARRGKSTQFARRLSPAARERVVDFPCTAPAVA